MKKADSILIKILRVTLLLFLTLVIVFVLMVKPYAKFLDGFRIQKYKTSQQATNGLLALHPVTSTTLTAYKTILGKNDIFCRDERRGNRIFNVCVGFENKIYARYKWEANIEINAKDKESVRSVVITKERVDNGFKALFKKK
ncbi:MAG: hypothetical protein LBG46_01525 [Elusimicrobiota bacterium]|nr:hypothetical protein [Elusimicrobiota bacterium]